MLNKYYANQRITTELLADISAKNPLHGKFLASSMEDITESETNQLERLIEFYIKRGDSIESIADKYLTWVQCLFEEQCYFMEHKKYRNTMFIEVEEIYKNSDYMENYIVGLGLSTYFWSIHRHLMRFYIENLPKKKGARFFEIGPGHGEYFVLSMQNTDFDKYVAIDISETCIEMTKSFIAHSLVAPNKNYELINIDFFKYKSSNHFDAVVMGEVLEHVEDPLKFLKSINEISNENAFIYISTAINAPQPDHIYQFRNIDEVTDLFHQANLDVVHQIALTQNNIPVEKAVSRSAVIVVGFVLKKMISNVKDGEIL